MTKKFQIRVNEDEDWLQAGSFATVRNFKIVTPKYQTKHVALQSTRTYMTTQAAHS